MLAAKELSVLVALTTSLRGWPLSSMNNPLLRAKSFHNLAKEKTSTFLANADDTFAATIPAQRH
jgi:hypothetical protein